MFPVAESFVCLCLVDRAWFLNLEEMGIGCEVICVDEIPNFAVSGQVHSFLQSSTIIRPQKGAGGHFLAENHPQIKSTKTI
jgi:hypothetical protein